MLAAGILTPVAAALLVAQSVVIIFKVHWSKGFFSSKGGFEFAFVLAMGSVAIGIAGPGQLSLDQLIKLELELELGEDAGQTFILVTHDSEVGDACDRVVRMRDGRVSGAAR